MCVVAVFPLKITPEEIAYDTGEGIQVSLGPPLRVREFFQTFFGSPLGFGKLAHFPGKRTQLGLGRLMGLGEALQSGLDGINPYFARI
ncbi:MAG TPA: hypothetical protein VGZ23_00935 [bacterium]|nr:hypothetical protein [bacterium]